ncbi:MAG TPA: DUF222 domain-containing protein [Actinomycetota bacterium]|jgi:hypothetical protein|nr:DUF222 domain-containing protein [Actinomycetota bacterium]
MSELRSAVEMLRSESLAELPDARIEDDFGELHRAVEQLEVERLRRLAEIDRRKLFERDGHLSTASWLVSAFKVAWGVAREHVRLAKALEQMPSARAAVDDGEVSLSSVRVLASARDADPEAFARAEPTLVDAARMHTVGDLARVASHWRDVAVQERARSDHDADDARRQTLYASKTFMGRVRADADLNAETGELLLTALNAVLSAEARSRNGDDRSPAERRADALGEICRQWLDLADRPVVAAERPHVTLTVGVETLKGLKDSTCELEHTGPMARETAEMLLCDCSVARVVLSGRSEPLDVGRRTPAVPASLRRAVVVRDRHCRFPGCDPKAGATPTMLSTGQGVGPRPCTTSYCCVGDITG